MINKKDLDGLRVDMSIQSKNGMDFILSASVIWVFIGFVWTLDFSAYNKSVLTFMIGAPMMPLAFLFSKVLKTNWKNKENPLQPFGIWLNVAQILYFPFLVFILMKMPDYFVMGYAIITGAHFLPYAWFYKTKVYIFSAIVLAVGALIAGLYLPVENMFIIPFATSAVLFIVVFFLYFDYKKKTAQQ